MNEPAFRAEVALVETFQMGGDVALPAPSELSEAEALSIYQHGELTEQLSQIIKGYAAASYEETHGEGTLEQFSNETTDAYSTVREHARVYKRIAQLPRDVQASLIRALREGALTYKHFVVTNVVNNDEAYVEILERAAANGWSRGQTAEAARIWRNTGYQPQELPSGLTVVDTETSWVEADPRLLPRADLERLVAEYRENGYMIAVPEERYEARYDVERDSMSLILVGTESQEIAVGLVRPYAEDLLHEMMEHANRGIAIERIENESS